MHIVKRSVNDLTFDPNNARAHGDRNIEAIRASLRRFGQALPIVINSQGQVIGGNGTLQAARDLGWSHINTIEYAGTGVEARALALALNRTAELATWDTVVLGETLVELAEAGCMPEDLGFDAEALEHMFPPDPEPAQDPFRTDAPDIAKTSEEPKPLIQYALIFDSEDQERRFHGWLAQLKIDHPDVTTQAARLDQHIQAFTPEVPE